MAARFNTPPGWPPTPAGWMPPPGWQPDPSWPSAPPGWVFWTDDSLSTPTDSAPTVPPPPGTPRPASRGWVAPVVGVSTFLVGLLVGVAIGGAGGSSAAQPQAVSTVTVTSGPAATVTVTATPVDGAPATTEAGESSVATEPETEVFVMPDVVGMNLQYAQDTLQSLGSYLMDQEDATTLDRFQVLDSNWQVCRQDPQPGEEVPVDTIVTLWSVKLDEACP